MTSETTSRVQVTCEQRTYPPYDAFHGTPHEMVWRQVTIETARGTAVFEQTDYGHPGRLNPWMSRGVDNALLPRLAMLLSVVESVGALM